jgi:hypothetical protein
MDSFSYHGGKHFLHASDRVWPSSNCYVSLWIELLHSLGYDPVPSLAFTLNLEDEGDQFTFFKFPTNDLESLYGVSVRELSIFNNLENHIALQVDRGNVVLVEVDGFYLPDTAGVSYKLLHTKTTIGINAIDVAAGEIRYFHNDIYGFLNGSDYNKIIRLEDKFDGQLFPYTEFVKLSSRPRSNSLQNLRAISRQSFIKYLKEHENLSSNPISTFNKRFLTQIQQLDSASFHEYAFNNFRMLGSNFELLGSYLKWLFPHKADIASDACFTIASSAKTLQFKVARMISKQKFDPCNQIFDEMVLSYETIFAQLSKHCMDKDFC